MYDGASVRYVKSKVVKLCYTPTKETFKIPAQHYIPVELLETINQLNAVARPFQASEKVNTEGVVPSELHETVNQFKQVCSGP